MAEKASALEKHRVHLIETGSSLDRMLSFFLTNLARNASLVAAEAAEVALIDYDAISAPEKLNQFRQTAPRCPVVALAYAPPEDRGLLHLAKPITLDQLEHFFKEAPWRSVSVKTESVKTEDGAKREKEKKQEKPSQQPPSSPAIVKISEVWEPPGPDLQEELYHAEEMLQGWLQRAYRKARLTRIPVRLNLAHGSIYLYPKEGIVVASCSDEHLYELCGSKLSKVEIEAAPEVLLTQHPKEHCFKIQPFLWKVALWCSRGRLEQRLMAKELFLFKRWPNLTRWLRTPSCLKIVAFFYNEAHEIEEAVNLLRVKEAEVYALLSAAAALDLLQFPGRKVAMAETAETTKEEKRTLLSLLKRLLRG